MPIFKAFDVALLNSPKIILILDTEYVQALFIWIFDITEFLPTWLQTISILF